MIGVDLVDERLDRARELLHRGHRHPARTKLEEVVQSHTDGRGADAVIDAVGMEAHGSPVATVAQTASGFLPSPVGRAVMKHAGVDRLAAFNSAIGWCAGAARSRCPACTAAPADPINMMTLFDKQIQLRMGQANVKKWIPDIMPLLTDEDPLGVEQFATHRLPLSRRPMRTRRSRRKRTAW